MTPAGSLLVPNPLTPLPWCRGGCPHIPPRGSRVPWAGPLGVLPAPQGGSRLQGWGSGFILRPQITPGMERPWARAGTAAPALPLLGFGEQGGHVAGPLTPPAFWRKAGDAK